MSRLRGLNSQNIKHYESSWTWIQ